MKSKTDLLMYMLRIQNDVKNLGQGVYLPNSSRNYCLYNPLRTKELTDAGQDALKLIGDSLKTANNEKQILDALQVIDKMLDNNVKNIDELYPILSRFNNSTSPNIQVMLAGIYRKTLIPDAFGPLINMFYDTNNSPYFDKSEEIGGAILEYLQNNAELNKAFISNLASKKPC